MSTRTALTVPTRFVEADGIRFAYRRWGKPGGLPLVFLNYFAGNLDDWDPLVTDGFAADHDVILFNNAGVASSEGETPGAVSEMARDTMAFCNALGLKMVSGANFTCFHAGPMEGWMQFRLEPPDVPVPMQGKLFLRSLLGSAALEMSLNVVPPGQGMPFLHRHRQNDEVYVVVGGRGQFLVDSECIDVAEGSVLRLCPAAARAWRNNSDAPLYFLCLQYRADSVIEGGAADGQKAEGNPAWPN